jgi:oligopeptide/dipeptide ABC transporter ATP-binding protein
VQAQTLNLMSDLERDAGVTFLLISHDLAVVAHICAMTAVMFRGRIVEIGDTDELFANPAHPYTRELVDATPRLDRPAHVQPLGPSNGVPQAAEGCPYAPRCAFARPRCRDEPPALQAKGDGSRKVACWYPLG